MKYLHLMSILSENERALLEGSLWQEGFFDAYFEELPGIGTSFHVLLEEDAPLPEFLSRIEFTDLGYTQEADWYKKWRETLNPFELCEGITVIPLEKKKLVPDVNLIGLIPGAAFGTGLHQSTKLAASLLRKHMRKNALVLDIGCGTGILSVLALKSGARGAVGLDIDRRSLEIARETAAINGVSLEIRESDFLSSIGSQEKFDFIVANMVAELLAVFVNKLEDHLAENGIVVLSGIYRDKLKLLSDSIEEKFHILETEEDGDWKALALIKK